MTMKLDVKLAKIRQEKQLAKESQLVQQVDDMKERYSGLLLKQRMLSSDEVDIHTSAREYIPIEVLDTQMTMPTQVQAAKAFFTVGVVVEVYGPNTSKTGKQFSTFKLSDLVKYDIAKVKKLLESQGGAAKEGVQEWVRLSEKSFNSNGYKTLKVMAFQEVALPISKLTVGTVVGLLNPRLMRSLPGSDHQNQGITFSVDVEAQVFRIGFSEELTFCKGVPQIS